MDDQDTKLSQQPQPSSGDTPEITPQSEPPAVSPPASPAPEPIKPVASSTTEETVTPENTLPVSGLEKPATPPSPNLFVKLLRLIKTHKRLSIPAGVVLLLALIFIVPASRYPVLALAVKKNFRVVVTDSVTGKPISSAKIVLDGHSALTNSEGEVSLKSKVGHRTLAISKKYYKDNSAAVLVPVLGQKSAYALKLEATGRQVPITVLNKISGQPVADALIKASDTEATTDKDGKTIIVLPADKDTVDSVIMPSGFNELKAEIKVTEQEAEENIFRVTPAGKVYFLSKLSGRIDVIKTDLDGANREVVLAGTGNEDSNDTVLLASLDWAHLALVSRRDATTKLYLIRSADGQLTTIDESDSFFTPIGWQGDTLIYEATRNDKQVSDDKFSSLKAYSAKSGQTTILDETSASSNGSEFAGESYTYSFIASDTLVFGKNWQRNGLNLIKGKQATINSVKFDGSDKRVLKGFAADGTYNPFLESRLFKPGIVHFRVDYLDSSNVAYYEVKNGQVSELPGYNLDKYYQEEQTYLVSPSGKLTLWYEYRDGKNSILTGDASAGNNQTIVNLSDYTPYGWYTDDYLLLSKGGSELFIMSAKGIKDETELIKISDYHRSSYGYQGYGNGYGGA